MTNAKLFWLVLLVIGTIVISSCDNDGSKVEETYGSVYYATETRSVRVKKNDQEEYDVNLLVYDEGGDIVEAKLLGSYRQEDIRDGVGLAIQILNGDY